jgi:hypothetical protein
MTGYQRRQIIGSGRQPAKRLRYNRCSEGELGSRLQAIKRIPLGTITVTSEKIHRNATGYLAIWGFCSRCKKKKEMLVNNIERGTAKGCKCCNGLKFGDDLRAITLRQRFSAIKQRCQNPFYQDYRNYGWRGIQNRFKDHVEFVSYVLTFLPHANYRGVDIGRIDNDGHNEPGNLTLEDRASNLRNKQTNRWVEYKGERIIQSDLYKRLRRDYPDFGFGRQWTALLAARGVSWEKILELDQQRSRRSTTS